MFQKFDEVFSLSHLQWDVCSAFKGFLGLQTKGHKVVKSKTCFILSHKNTFHVQYINDLRKNFTNSTSKMQRETFHELRREETQPDRLSKSNSVLRGKTQSSGKNPINETAVPDAQMSKM